jgi:hypothetical protein
MLARGETIIPSASRLIVELIDRSDTAEFQSFGRAARSFGLDN